MSFAIIGVSVAASGTGVAIYGQQQAASAAEDVADYNADVARIQAEHETEVATENARRKTRENAKLIGLQREALAASGLAPAGTPLAILGESVSMLTMDVLDMGYEAEARARALRSDAAMGLYEGASTGSALRTQSIATGFSGAASATGSFLSATGKVAPKQTY